MHVRSAVMGVLDDRTGDDGAMREAERQTRAAEGSLPDARCNLATCCLRADSGRETDSVYIVMISIGRMGPMTEQKTKVLESRSKNKQQKANLSIEYL